MKTYGGVNVKAMFSWPRQKLEVRDQLYLRFISYEGATSTYWIGGWMVLRDGLGDMEKWTSLTLPGHELRLHSPRHEDIWRCEGNSPPILTSILSDGHVSAALIPATIVQYNGCALEAVGQRGVENIFVPARNRNRALNSPLHRVSNNIPSK
jgi:hypothetical protein